MKNLSALDRLQRLLAIIPWVATEGGMPIEDIVRRFDYPRNELLEDLWFVVQMTGVAPFGPGDMLEVLIEDDFVRIEYNHWFTQPMTLRSDEVLRLVTVANTAADFLGDENLGALGRAITKLTGLVDETLRGAVDIQLGVADQNLLNILKSAIGNRQPVQIEYYSYSRNELTQRTVEPQHLSADGGHWYLLGHCRSAQAFRIFRLDRVSRYDLLEGSFQGEELSLSRSLLEDFLETDTHPEVELLLDPSARWVLSQYPAKAASVEGDGRLRIRFAVASQAWFERLLLRLGPAAEICDAPQGMDVGVRRSAALRILSRYEEEGNS